MPMSFDWEDPPKRVVNNAEFEEVLSALYEAPGEWACVFAQGTESEMAARNVRPRLMEYAKRRGIEIEAVTRKVDGRVRVYARGVDDEDVEPIETSKEE